LHQLIKRTLRLTFQLEGVDYLAPNFVHADVTLEEFERLRGERGESMLTLMGDAIRAEIMGSGTSKSQFSLRDLFALFGAAGGADRLKYSVGKQMGKMGDLLAGPEMGSESTIIGDRNRAAMAVLKRELAAGRKRIAVFYGAGHLPHMDEILTGEMGFQDSGEEWLNAWDVDKTKLKSANRATEPAEPAPAPAPASK
jgi:hypothetical protein